MSGRLLRLVCTAALATQVALVPGAAVAVPEPDGSAEPSVAELLTDLQKLYRDAERATEAYNATEEQLRRKRAEVARLDGQLARARLALDDSRGEAGGSPAGSTSPAATSRPTCGCCSRATRSTSSTRAT